MKDGNIKMSNDIQALAKLARPQSEEDWGSDRQLEAENNFWNQLKVELGDKAYNNLSGEIESSKMDIEEMIDYALSLLEKEEEISHPHYGSIRRFWYHSLRGRKLGDSGEITAYLHRDLQRLIREDSGESSEFPDIDLCSFDPKFSDKYLPTGFVEEYSGIMLSPHPLTEDALAVDVSKLNLKKFKFTFQAEGYAYFRDSIPASALVKR